MSGENKKMRNFLVELKSKKYETDRKFPIESQDSERAKQWGEKQANQLGLPVEDTRIITTEVIK